MQENNKVCQPENHTQSIQTIEEEVVFKNGFDIE